MCSGGRMPAGAQKLTSVLYSVTCMTFWPRAVIVANSFWHSRNKFIFSNGEAERFIDEAFRAMLEVSCSSLVKKGDLLSWDLPSEEERNDALEGNCLIWIVPESVSRNTENWVCHGHNNYIVTPAWYKGCGNQVPCSEIVREGWGGCIGCGCTSAQ